MVCVSSALKVPGCRTAADVPRTRGLSKLGGISPWATRTKGSMGPTELLAGRFPPREELTEVTSIVRIPEFSASSDPPDALLLLAGVSEKSAARSMLVSSLWPGLLSSLLGVRELGASSRGTRSWRRLCCRTMCAFMLCLEVNSLLQLDTGQRLFGASTSCKCFLEWMYRLLRAENLAQHPSTGHSNGFVPRWVILWPFRCSALVNDLPQPSTGQVNLRSSSCFLLCLRSLDMLVKVQPQLSESQINGLSPV